MGLTGDMGLLLMSTILPIQNVRHHTYSAWSRLIHSLLHFIRVYFSSPSAPIEGITSTDTVQSFVSISTFCCTSPYGWKEVSEHLVTPLGFEPRTPSLKVRCSIQAELRSEKTHIIELTIDVGTETIFNTLLYPIELKWTYPPMGLEPITYGLQGIEVLL